MKKKIMFVISIVMLCFCNLAFASYSPQLNGRPNGFDPGNSLGYFIWQDKHGLHIRTSTAGAEHVFSGSIRTDGAFEDVFGKAPGKDDYFRISDDHDKINFRITNSGEEYGIDLHALDGTYVKLDLNLDGEEIDSSKIFIGNDNWHPGSNKFILRHASDPEKHNDDDQTVVVVDGYYWWHPHYVYWGPVWHHHWHRWY